MKFVRSVLLAAAVGASCISPVAAQPANVVTIDVRDVPLVDVVRLIATQGRMSIICDPGIATARVTFRFSDVSPRTVLDAIERSYNLSEIVRDGIIRIVPSASASTSLDPAADIVTVALPTHGVNAQAVLGALQLAIPSASIVASPTGKAVVVTAAPAAIARARSILNGLSNDGAATTPVTVVPLRFLGAADAARFLTQSGFVEGGTTIVPDEARLSLLVRANDDSLARIRGALAAIDRPAPVIDVEVQVLDVTDNGSSNTGILLGGYDASGNPSVGSAFLSFTKRAIPINATISALVSNGSARVLASPRVSVTNGETGKILVGSNYPIQTSTNGLVGSSQVQFLQIGVQLQIHPTIGSDGSVALDLTTTYSQITGLAPTTNYPIVGTRTVDSHIRVQDGEPVVLAGLFSEVNNDTVSAVPGLVNIPIFGGIFRNRQKSTTKDEIVFVLRPHLGLEPGKDEPRAPKPRN